METSCTKCGGFIGEPGKAYGYAGKWCHCPVPSPMQPYAPIRPIQPESDTILMESVPEKDHIEEALKTIGIIMKYLPDYSSKCVVTANNI